MGGHGAARITRALSDLAALAAARRYYSAVGLFKRFWVVFIGLVAGVLMIVAAGIYTAIASADAAGRYGSVAMPGRAVLQLPAGTVKISYFETYYDDTPSDGDSVQPISVPGFNLRVDALSGSPAPAIHFHQGTSSTSSTVNGHTSQHVQVGTLQVSAAGRYRIVVSHIIDASAQTQQLRFGTGEPLSPVALAAFIIGPLLILGFLIRIIVSLRGAFRKAVREPDIPAITGGPGRQL